MLRIQIRPGVLILVAAAVLLAFPTVAWLLSRDVRHPVAWDTVLPRTAITVYSSPLCGCCTEYERYLESHGMIVAAQKVVDPTVIKQAHALPPHAWSCHTALVNGYVVEGHMPAPVIAQLLAESPDVDGIALPGMPPGSPGMDGSKAGRWDIFAVDEGRTAVYTKW